MKIAYLANVRFPSERAHAAQIGHMCQAFSKNGARVDLIVSRRVNCTKEEVDKQLGFSTQYNVIRIPSLFLHSSIKASFYLSEFIFSISFLLTQGARKYDFIYTRHEWIAWILSYFISTKKIVWESHEAKLILPVRSILNNGVITVVISEGIYEDYCNYGVPKKQMIIAHDGIDESFFGKIESRNSARGRLSLLQDKKIVMYIGGFDDWKGVHTFCSAKKLIDDVDFVAIGGTAGQVSEFTDKYPEVIFLGSLPYSDLKNNQQAADVLVIPNTAKNDLSLKYTSPLKLFAHMASGVPIVASDIPSIRNVVDDTQVTFIEPDSAQALADGARVVLHNSEEKKKMALKLREFSKQYTWNNRAQSILKFITNN